MNVEAHMINNIYFVLKDLTLQLTRSETQDYTLNSLVSRGESPLKLLYSIVIFNTAFSKLGWANKQVVGSSPAVALSSW
jgi:hypothetical protein